MISRAVTGISLCVRTGKFLYLNPQSSGYNGIPYIVCDTDLIHRPPSAVKPFCPLLICGSPPCRHSSASPIRAAAFVVYAQSSALCLGCEQPILPSDDLLFAAMPSLIGFADSCRGFRRIRPIIRCQPGLQAAHSSI